MSHPDVSLLRAALDAAIDGITSEDLLDEETAAAVRRWLAPHGPADGAYCPARDIEDLLSGCA
jgi:hypothetical protein